MAIEVTISTDQDYWGERAPTRAEVKSFVAEIKIVARKWGETVNVDIVDGDYSNNEEGQELVDRAWAQWCAK